MSGDVVESAGDSAEESPGDRPSGSFPIVGIGGSAGALEAVRDLLRDLPPDTGMGFVYIQHLDPTRKSILAEILSRETVMPVVEATEGLQVSPNCVYILPPNRTMVISHGVLRLAERLLPAGLHLPIDEFLRSLAEDQGASAIAIVLSGASSDGALGLQAVKQSGGITFAQDDSARHPIMPHHAINTGAVDFVLPPRGIVKELARIARHPYIRKDPEELMEVFPPGTERFHREILAALQAAKGTDFSSYRPTTLKRRIARRMALRHTERIEDYARLVTEDQEELDALFNEVLIKVTSFFRDPQIFAALAEQLLSPMVKDRPRGQQIRIWVPACSTGEEAYSLAIALVEALGAGGTEYPIQIFGTDVSERAINRARAGVFVENISMDVSAERLEHFFRKTDDHYRIVKSVRDLCVFARHDITRDPPFSNLDLVTCRNLLIYMSPELQRRVLDTLHYALKPGGYLVLGSSESLFQYQEMFSVVDAKHRFFCKTGGSGNRMALGKARLPAGRRRPEDRPGASSESDMIAEADRVLFARDGHSGVLIQGSGRILQFRGDTSRYLAPASGPASFDL
jgi:two-component system CheB/CheR fusion protein